MNLNRIVIWFVLPLMLSVFCIQVFFLSHVHGMSRSIVARDTLTSAVSMTICVWGMLLLISAYPTKVALLFYSLILSVTFTVINVYTDWFILKYWIGNTNSAYFAILVHSVPIRIIIDLLVLLLIAIYAALRKRVLSIEEKYSHQADAATLLREAELFKLRQQLQPHFLYNSLNSISALIMIQPDKAQEMIGKLSEFLRSSVKREAQDVIPIAEELTYIQAYLAIESVRFGDRLQVQFEKEYTDDATVPPFLMQPILENAIKYGLYGKTGNVTITMHIVLQDSMLVITVTNPYDPQTQSSKGTGFGLEGIRRRLYLLYARTDLLETKKDDELFTTILKIPQSHV